MRFRRTCVAAACGLVAACAFAQSTPAPQRIEITGSAIKRTDRETPAPIEVVTREDIVRTGATTINELIKSVAVIDINDQGELGSNSPGGSGTARLRLRGLGDTNTLVLINGRRVPKNPLADATGAGSAFNVNSIPVAAIERVEILKDGGSAIYGADAVAGVINFILRRDFTGYSAKALLGTSSRSDGTEKQFSGVAGFGGDRWNVMAAVDVFQRDPILRKDRELTKSVDFRAYGPVPGYNLDGRSVFSPYGNFLTAAGGLAGQTVTPCPPEAQSGPLCVYDFNASLLTSYNGADRVSGLVNASFQLTPDHGLYARVIASQMKDHFDAHPVPDFFTYTDGRRYAGRFLQGGPRITDKTGDLLHLDVGAEGVVAGLDYKVGISSGRAKAVNRDSNYFNRTLWNQATSSGAIDATSQNNPQALVDSLKVSPVRSAEETIDSVDAQLGGEWFKLPGGASRWAVGLSALREQIEDTPDPLTQQGLVVGSIQQSAVAASRSVKAVFGELQLPIFKSLEAQIAARYDDYGPWTATSPKVGVKWDLSPALALRASYSEAFKAPTLKQQFASAGQGAITLTPAQCQQVGNAAIDCVNGLPAFRITGSNPNLQPEEGKHYNIGVIGDVGPLSFAVDFWQIDKENNISTPTLQTAIDQGLFFRDASNRVNVLQNLQNFAQSKNAGVDVDGKLTFRGMALGDLTLRASGTYYRTQSTRTTAADPWAEFNGTYATPRWRSSISATLVRGPWTAQGLVRGWGSFRDTDLSWTAINSAAGTPGGNRRVGSYDEVDLTLAWAGWKNVTLSGAVKNVFDRMPPFSARNASSNNYTQMGFAELYTPRGRFFQVGAEVRF